MSMHDAFCFCNQQRILMIDNQLLDSLPKKLISAGHQIINYFPVSDRESNGFHLGGSRLDNTMHVHNMEARLYSNLPGSRQNRNSGLHHQPWARGPLSWSTPTWHRRGRLLWTSGGAITPRDPSLTRSSSCWAAPLLLSPCSTLQLIPPPPPHPAPSKRRNFSWHRYCRVEQLGVALGDKTGGETEQWVKKSCGARWSQPKEGAPLPGEPPEYRSHGCANRGEFRPNRGRGASFRFWKGMACMLIGVLIRIPTDRCTAWPSSSSISLWFLRKGRERKKAETTGSDCVRRLGKKGCPPYYKSMDKGSCGLLGGVLPSPFGRRLAFAASASCHHWQGWRRQSPPDGPRFSARQASSRTEQLTVESECRRCRCLLERLLGTPSPPSLPRITAHSPKEPLTLPSHAGSNTSRPATVSIQVPTERNTARNPTTPWGRIPSQLPAEIPTWPAVRRKSCTTRSNWRRKKKQERCPPTVELDPDRGSCKNNRQEKLEERKIEIAVIWSSSLEMLLRSHLLGFEEDGWLARISDRWEQVSDSDPSRYPVWSSS